jgi:hypothetical protein
MSATRRVALAQERRNASPPAEARERLPHLTLVRRPVRRAARTPFAVLLVMLAGVGLVGLLLINTRLQAGAVELSRLDRDNQILRERAQSLSQSVEVASAPHRLASRAQDLGMVPNSRPAFLRLSDGAVLGDPEKAEAPPPPPAPAPVPAPEPVASPPADQAAVVPAEPTPANPEEVPAPPEEASADPAEPATVEPAPAELPAEEAPQ